MQKTPPIRRRKASEDGYTLIAVIILLAIFVIAAAVAIPKVAESIQRDRELETMHRGKQYIRAIQLYYRKFHAYPPNMDALVKSNEIRFLRKKYVDPVTGKDDWKPIMYCQNKTPMAMGFFGQPLAGAGCGALAGIGPGGGNGVGGAGSMMPGSSGAGGAVGLFPNTGSGGAGTQAGASPTTGATGTDAGSSGGPVDANGTPIGGSGGTSGQTFGGAGIVGVEPASPKQSILIYKKKNHYNEWEFLYSPMSDQQMIAGGNAGGLGQQGAPGMNQNGGAAGGLFGGGGGIGGGAELPGGNNGSTPIQPPATIPIQPPDPPSTTPQQ